MKTAIADAPETCVAPATDLPHVEAQQNHLSFWREKLATAPVLPRPLLDDDAGSEATAERALLPIALPPNPTIEKFAALAQREHLASTCVPAACWLALIARYTEQSDLTIASAGDTFEAPLQVHFDPRRSFAELLAQTSTAIANAQRYALADSDDWRLVLPSVTFADAEKAALRYAIAFGRVNRLFQTGILIPGAAPCEFVLMIPPDWPHEPLLLACSHRAISGRGAQRIADHFRELLTAAVSSPSESVDALPLLPETETAQLAAWNATEADHDWNLSLAAMFAAQAVRTPHLTAIASGNEKLDYAALDERANQLANELRKRGVGPDVPVAINLERSILLMVAVLGVLKAGGAYVPIDPAYPPARQRYMIKDSGARVLITRGPSSEATDLPGDLSLLQLAEGWSALSQHPKTAPIVNVRGEHLAYIIYTSGSTGTPKGVALPQRTITNLVAWQLRQPHFRPRARTLQFSSISFDVSCQELFSTWCSGGTLVLIDELTRRDSAQLLDHLVQQRIERLFLPFVALRGLAEIAVRTARYPTELREIYTAGEQLRIDATMRMFFTALPECVLENQYGPSEAHVVTAHTLRGTPDQWPALPPIGRAIANAHIHILNRARQPQPIGIPGELFIGGRVLARGYIGKPDVTAERFIRDPLNNDALSAMLYCTGDLARWRSDGTIEFLGRIDQQVKFRGYRIEPGEIATVLSSAPDIAQCVVLVRETEHGARLVAYIVLATGARLSLAELRRRAREQLPDFMVPTHYVLLNRFPLTPSGKLDQRALPAPEFDRDSLAQPFTAPRSLLEEKLAGLWSRLLGVPQVGVHDDFFELGGDSLKAVEMLAELRRTFGRDLPLGTLAREPNIAALARALEDTDHAQHWRSLVPLQTSGTRPPIFCVHGGSGNVASYPLLSRQLPPDQPFFALQWSGLDGTRGHTSIPSMARHYLRELAEVRPHGPYVFGGQCVGGLIALEMTRQTLARNESVELLFLVDTPHVHSPLTQSFRRWPRVLRWLLHGQGRRQSARIYWLPRLGFKVPEHLRQNLAANTMVAAVWHYRMELPPVPVLLLCSGSRTAGTQLGAVWEDGLMGWSPFLTENVRWHRITANHSDILQHPDTAHWLTTELNALHSTARVQARGVATVAMA